MSFASDIGRMVARGPQRPMTSEESLTMLQIAFMAEEDPNAQLLVYRDLLSKSQALQIIDARFRACIGEDVKFSPTLLIWLSALADRPGNAVLLVAVLAYMLEEGKELTLQNLCGSYFADGIPTQVAYQLAWDAQKRTDDNVHMFRDDEGKVSPFCDNVLDLAAAWK